MRALLSWLQDFVEIPEPPAELAEALTLAGMAVDGIDEEDGETILDLDVTSNRPDAMNHFGLAREIAAIYGRSLKPPVIVFPEDPRRAAEFASIEILDPDLCPRYVGRVLLDVEIRPSPVWLRRRLELCGVRSINNIADLTNYALLDLGHPTHAFDLDNLAERRIEVRRARAGEELRTLDGIVRKLTLDDLVIADAYRPVALAGVMGGLETEISDRTRNVLIEAAWFQPGAIRRTAKRFGMHTEASHRFERGADIGAAPWAADRIAGLLGQISPGVVLQGRIDRYHPPRERPAIVLRRARVRQILGAEIPDQDVVSILGRLGFRPAATEDGWTAPALSHRLDVEREIDLIEELVRVWGFDRIPSTLPGVTAAPTPTPHEAEEAVLRQSVRALGYDETIGYSFLPAGEAERFSETPAVAVRNPLSELMAVMRPTTVPTMLRALQYNLNRGEPNVRLAEFGRVYHGGEGEYEEPPLLSLAATGAARVDSLHEPGRPLGFFDLKADIAALLERFDLEQIDFRDSELPAYFAEGRAAAVVTERGLAARLGEIDPGFTEDYKIRQPVFLAEVFLEPLYQSGLRRPQHRAIPKTPAVARDFSLLVPEGVPFAEIRRAIGPMADLESVEPAEIFRGKQVPEGYYALLLRTVWQGGTSFTDEEIASNTSALLDSLHTKLRIQLRS